MLCIMPFKTKRQKLAAAQRRFTFSDSGLAKYQIAEEKKGQVQEAEGQTADEMKTSRVEIEDLSYVKLDLVKILLFASLIIGAQILLSFVRA